MDQDDQTPAFAGLFDGDTGDAPAAAREVITHMVKNPVLWGRDSPRLWEALREHQQAVVRHFHNMYVEVVINPTVQIAYKQQVHPDGEDYSVVVRAKTFTLEASVLALYAREQLALAGGERVLLGRAEIREQIEPYWPADATNHDNHDKKVNGAIQALVDQDLLLREGPDRWEVSPAVALVFNAEAITRFTDLLTTPQEPTPGQGDPDPQKDDQ